MFQFVQCETVKGLYTVYHFNPNKKRPGKEITVGTLIMIWCDDPFNVEAGVKGQIKHLEKIPRP